VRATFIAVLEEEVTQVIGAARYERTTTRRDHWSGYCTRDLFTKVGLIEDLLLPKTRGGFRT